MVGGKTHLGNRAKRNRDIPAHSGRESHCLWEFHRKESCRWKLILDLLGLHGHILDNEMFDMLLSQFPVLLVSPTKISLWHHCLPMGKVYNVGTIHSKLQSLFLARRWEEGLCRHSRRKVSGFGRRSDGRSLDILSPFLFDWTRCHGPVSNRFRRITRCSLATSQMGAARWNSEILECKI